ncbi:MAG: imidazole glycerol phosphate synthase, glutamine amidotransferase subunit, partial [Candidatus Schekmanbacteria bacterium RBG_13_48_7]
MVGIVDYKMGNLLSVFNALEYIGEEPVICTSPKQLHKIEKIILPGVGAFGDCINTLTQTGFSDMLNEMVTIKKKPILGICLGMQVMAKYGYESGGHDGLGWFDAEVILIEPDDKSLHIPHVGWNNISYQKSNPLFKNIPDNADTYFVHSFYMKCNNKNDVIATCDYGMKITAAVNRN